MTILSVMPEKDCYLIYLRNICGVRFIDVRNFLSLFIFNDNSAVFSNSLNSHPFLYCQMNKEETHEIRWYSDNLFQ